MKTEFDKIIEQTVAIPVERYEELLNAEKKLGALEASGVDNWSGYDDAMEWLEESEFNG